MTITPSDSLDLLIARGPPDATDFAKQIAGLPGAYYAGLDEAYKRRTQDAFQNGLPTTDPNDPKSPVDITALYKTMLTTGGVPSAVAGIGGLQQQANQQTALEAARRAFPLPGDQLPPSTAPTSVPAPALRSTSGPSGSSNGNSPTSVNAAVSGAGFSGADAGSLMTRIAQGLGVDPDQNLDPVKQAQVATAVQRAVEARQQRTQPAAAPAPAAPPTVAFNDRFRGEQPAPGVQPSQSTLATVQDPAVAAQRRALEDRKARLQSVAATLQAIDPKDERVQIYRDQIAAIDKQLEPTEAQRNAMGDKLPGETDAAYAARKAGAEESAKKFAGIGSEVFDTARKGYEAAQTAKYRLDLIDHSISQLGPQGWMGAYAGTRAETAKTLNSAADALLPAGLASRFKIDPSKIANVEDFNKQTQTLGFELAKTLGSREAMQIVQQATSSVPNVNQSPLGAKLVSGSLRQASQRAEDFYKYMVNHKGELGAEIKFNQQNPPEMYSTRAIAASGIPVPITGGQQQVDWLPKDTKFVWGGKPWTKQ